MDNGNARKSKTRCQLFVVADEGFYLSELQGRRLNPHLFSQYSLSSFLRMLNMFQVVIWEEPALLAIRHFPIFYEKSRVVMQDGDMGDERVLRATVRGHSEASKRINRIGYFSIIGRHFLQRARFHMRGPFNGCDMPENIPSRFKIAIFLL